MRGVPFPGTNSPVLELEFAVNNFKCRGFYQPLRSVYSLRNCENFCPRHFERGVSSPGMNNPVLEFEYEANLHLSADVIFGSEPLITR